MKNNLLLISLDTVRADVAYSGKFAEIESIRKRGVTFLNTVSSSPLTPGSHATVLTGLQPYNHGIRHLFREKLNKEVTTLAEILKHNGHKTGAIVSCPGMNSWYGLDRGFDHYDDEIPKLADGSNPLTTVNVKMRGTAFKRAEEVTKRAWQWLVNWKSTPFFLFIHFFDAHWPYNAPEKFGGNNAYEEEVSYSTFYLGQFLKKMYDEDMMKDTTLVCFSDHGEDLEGIYPNDKGGQKLGNPQESGHGCLLYNQTQKVVLIINDKQLPKGINIETQVRLVDVVPTIIDLLKIKHDFNLFDGTTLLPIINEKKFLNLIGYSETYYPEEQNNASSGRIKDNNKKSYLIENRFKVIIHLETNKVEFYDLKKDPYELNNLTKKS